MPRRIALGSLLIICCVLVASCNWGTGDGTAARESAYARVMRTGQLRVGYISYPPSFQKDPNSGEYSGIFHEVLQEAAREMGVKVDYVEEVAWGTMIESVESGRVDLVCTGIWPTGARARRAEFSNPIYFSAIKAYVRADDARFDGRIGAIDDSQVRIATIDGEMTSVIARSSYPRAATVSYPQTADISQMLLEVVSNKADVTFVETAVGEAFAAKNPGKIRAVASVAPVRVFPNVMMVAKGEFELLSLLNVTLGQLANDGSTDRAISRYETHPGSFRRVSLPYQ